MMQLNHSAYIQRCFDLARLGRGFTAPNPIVGALIVYQDRIIGEGYHQRYGGPHAEVNAVNSVSKKDLYLLKESCLYVSLEPCSIYGKTPPCTNLILQHKIPKVVISCIDHSPGVDGMGVKILQDAGVEVILNVLGEEGKRLSATRNTFVIQRRPYIILKYALSLDGFIAPKEPTAAFWMTNPYSKRLVHKWRSESDAILVGTNTALLDNPQLNNRYFYGPSPTRLVIDKSLRLPPSLRLFDGTLPTFVYTNSVTPPPNRPNLNFVTLKPEQNTIQQILDHLYLQNKTSLIVEGGAQLLADFIQQGLWDEARIFTSPVYLAEGIPTPPFPKGSTHENIQIATDQLRIIQKEFLRF
ncbi:MAG: bifunctional diaminohydroxyphosphoribosylaminopyrimidine deaminase/5-amino-6-(5-phosphoribosylamino)uracil reductase RibD [Saprospiraceae bacterium]